MAHPLRETLDEMVERRDAELFANGSPPREGLPAVPDQVRAGLIESGARRRLADRLKADASLDLAAWTRAAIAAGLTKVEISELSGASRSAIDAWLAR